MQEGVLRIEDVSLDGHIGPLSCTLAVMCLHCTSRFSVQLHTLAGTFQVELRCPKCGIVDRPTPTDVAVIIAEKIQHADTWSHVNSETANDLLERWHVVPPWRDAVSWQGLDLGKNAEYQMNGLMSAEVYTSLQRQGEQP